MNQISMKRLPPPPEVVDATLEEESGPRRPHDAPENGIGERLKIVRAYHGWSWSEFEERAGVGKSVLTSYGSGKRRPGGISAEVLMKAAEAAGVRPAWLLSEEGPMRHPEPLDPESARARALVAARLLGLREEAILAIAEMATTEDESESDPASWLRLIESESHRLKRLK